MNRFALATRNAIQRNGILSTYKRITTGAYDPNTGIIPSSELSYSFKIYMKQIIANQFNYPSLIDKESGLFYIDASQINFIPKAQDVIIYNSKTYKITSTQSFSAGGSIILYKVIGVV